MISLTACALQTSIPTPASTCQPIFIQTLIIKCRLWNQPCWSHHALVLPLLVVLCCSLQHFPHSNYCFEAHLESLSECVCTWEWSSHDSYSITYAWFYSLIRVTYRPNIKQFLQDVTGLIAEKPINTIQRRWESRNNERGRSKLPGWSLHKPRLDDDTHTCALSRSLTLALSLSQWAVARPYHPGFSRAHKSSVNTLFLAVTLCSLCSSPDLL